MSFFKSAYIRAFCQIRMAEPITPPSDSFFAPVKILPIGSWTHGNILGESRHIRGVMATPVWKQSIPYN